MEFIAQTIRKTGFPIDKTVLLIGAVLDAKGKLEGAESTVTINRYIELYNEFAARQGIEEFEEAAEESDVVVSADLSNEASNDGRE